MEEAVSKGQPLLFCTNEGSKRRKDFAPLCLLNRDTSTHPDTRGSIICLPLRH